MRVTDRMIVNHTLFNLNRGRERLGAAQERVATGKRILRPSDDPPGVERALSLSSNLRAVENQVENLSTSRRWLNGTDVALNSLNDLMIQATDLALRAKSDTNAEDEITAIANEMKGIVENTLSVANSRDGDYYLFAGQQSRTLPFEESGGAYVYQGDNEEIVHMVEMGQTMPINITGVEGANGGILNLLNRLNTLQQELEAQDKSGIDNFLTAAEDIKTDLYVAQSTVGSRMQRIDDTSARLEQRTLEIKQVYSRLVDADMAETISEMTAEERSYQLTLNAASRALPRSLLDFLR